MAQYNSEYDDELPELQSDETADRWVGMIDSMQDAQNVFLDQLNLDDDIDNDLDTERQQSTDLEYAQTERRRLTDFKTFVDSESEPVIPDETIPPADESRQELLEVLAEGVEENWRDLLPVLLRRGVDIGTGAGLGKKDEHISELKERVADLENQLRQAQDQLDRVGNRPSPASVDPDFDQQTIREYREMLIPVLAPAPIYDKYTFEIMLSHALKFRDQLNGEDTFMFSRIEEFRGLNTSIHSDKSDLHLAATIATGWCSSPRLVGLTDINQLSRQVSRGTPPAVYGFMVSLLWQMEDVVAGEFVYEDDQMPTNQAIMILRLLQFLLHHVRGTSDRLWDTFLSLRTHLVEARSSALVEGLFATLSAWRLRGNTTLAKELGKKTEKFTVNNHHFVLDGADLLILDDADNITFVPSPDYKVKLERVEQKWQWIVLVDSPVLGKQKVVLCEAAPGTTQSIKQVFHRQLKAQRSSSQPDSAKMRDIRWT